MRIRVDLLPATTYRDVVVVIDVLRTCTVAPILFDRGVSDLALTGSLGKARKRKRDGWLLLGERNGIPLEGFNFGRSPAELRRQQLDGRPAILVSKAATKVVSDLGEPRHVLLGSLYNALAVAERAAGLAREEVALVCCGFQGEPDLDDSLTAGFLCSLLLALGEESTLTADARYAISLLRAFPDPLEALWQSSAGHHLRRLALDHDLAVASQIALSNAVPKLAATDGKGDQGVHVFVAAEEP